MDRPTWTYKPDLPDPKPKPCTIEQDQVNYLIERLGLAKWGDLCQMEMEEENA